MMEAAVQTFQHTTQVQMQRWRSYVHELKSVAFEKGIGMS